MKTKTSLASTSARAVLMAVAVLSANLPAAQALAQSAEDEIRENRERGDGTGGRTVGPRERPAPEERRERREERREERHENREERRERREDPPQRPERPNREERREGREERREERREDRPERREERRERREERREDRPERREERRENREDRREDRRDNREDRRDDRRDRREDRRDERWERREDRREWRFNRDQWRRDWDRRHRADRWWRNHNWFRDYSGFRLNFYYAPGYGYYSVPRSYWNREWRVGDFIPSIFRRYEVQDWSWYGLPYPPAGTVWIYVDNDIYLIDRYDGYVVDAIYNVWAW